MKKIVLVLSIFLLIFFNANSQWIPMSDGMGNKSVRSMAVNSNIILAGTDVFGLYFSTNNGDNWIHSSLNSRPVLSLAINGGFYFAGTIDSGIYLSTNNGVNWIQTSLNNLTILSLVVSNSNIFAGTGNGVFKSTNNGQTWLQTSLNNRAVYSLGANQNNIFAGTNQFGIYLSTNLGLSWSQTIINNQFIGALAVSGNKIFAGYSFGLYLSTNNGINWSLSSLTNVNVASLAVNDNNVFAGVDGNLMFWASTNSGLNWFLKIDYLPMVGVYSIGLLNPYIFAGTNGFGVFRRPLSELIGLKLVSEKFPDKFSLNQNYPNPFNPITSFKFQVPSSGLVKIIVYDILGREVQTLVNEQLSPGTYEADFDGSNFSSGIYFYKLISDKYVESKKMVLIK